jgi:hypothetical protein
MKEPRIIKQETRNKKQDEGRKDEGQKSQDKVWSLNLYAILKEFLFKTPIFIPVVP